MLFRSQKDFWVNNEISIQQKIIKIEDWKNYFYIYENICKLQISNLNNITPIISTINKKNNNMFLLEYNDITITPLKIYLKRILKSKKYILSIIEFYKQMIKSIELLSFTKIVHNFINFDSIAVDNKENVLLTNFSFSIDFNQSNMNDYIKNFFVTYDPTYTEWPLELHILSYILTNKLKSISKYNIEVIIQNYIDNNYILKTFDTQLVNSYKEESLIFFLKYVNKSEDYILTDIMKYYNTWDNYEIGRAHV